jgi:hypothetical protein
MLKDTWPYIDAFLLGSRSGDDATDIVFFKENPIYSKDHLDKLEILFQQYMLIEDPTKPPSFALRTFMLSMLLWIFLVADIQQ